MVLRKKLTDQQKQIVNRKGLFVVKARPGSGKTFAVAARFAQLLSSWEYPHRGIAVISFTNVAWQEIERYLTEDFGIKTPVSYPHFLGTIDSFFNRYTFLPFGHLIMGCKTRPQLIGPPVNNWEPIGNGYWWGVGKCNRMCKLNHFSYDSDGNLISIAYPAVFHNCTLNPKPCSIKKREINLAGYATQADSRYYSMRVLQEFPQIVKALIYRFPILMIDEAQDTSVVEMKTIDTLIEKGLDEVMLIGDVEQAIFEWRNARPDLLETKYKQWKNNSLTLDENWRSSQNICNFFNKISLFSEAPKSVDKNIKEYPFSPVIWEYKEGSYLKIISDFLNLCKKHNIKGREKIAILFRSKGLLKTFQSGTKASVYLSPWQNELTASVCESKTLYDRGKFKDGLHCLEKGICKKINNLKFCSSADLEEISFEYGFTKWRRMLYEILARLPKTDCALGEWIEQANTSLNNELLIKNGDLSIKQRGKYKKDYAAMSFKDLFPDDSESDNDCSLGTIHSVKGGTFDAVLVAFKKNAGDKRKYQNILNDDSLNSEELRIIYVAITRPRKILVIAVPEGEGVIWQNKFCHEDSG
ncbi:MAG: ATP-dependent helicase [Planctomycetes bacterium]|nr:ATP-dependent helicase [Planctomycetota bacterium]